MIFLLFYKFYIPKSLDLFCFPFTFYINYTKSFLKDQSKPPYGKPQIISGWRGCITGSGLFYTPIQFVRGLFRHEIIYKFPVIVAEQCDFRKHRAKRTKCLRKCHKIICFHSFQRKYTMIFVVFCWNRLLFCIFCQFYGKC